MEEIKEFLSIVEFYNFHEDGDGDGNGNGYGNGYGNGNGYGDGYGYGNGYGNGYGDGDGDGNGNGDENGDGNGDRNGYGDGYGLKSLNNQSIYLIDDIQTIISNVKNNIAKGFIINSDLSLSPCYVVKEHNCFSHGNTIKEALNSLNEKLLINLPINERIIKFKDEFNDVSKKYNALKFYNWHYLLTGSCKMGRNSFVKINNIDLKKDKFTIKEFISLVKESYGSNIILELEKNLV